MTRFYSRRHLHHFPRSDGAVFITWRLERTQPFLHAEERDEILAIVRRIDDPDSHLLAAVIMDDHVHALVRLGATLTTSKVVQTWKSVSAHRLTKSYGRVAPVWQRDYFDRCILSVDRIERCRAYIMDNPRRRWPDIDGYRWIINA